MDWGHIFTVIGFAGIITITIKKFCLKEKINFDLNKLMQNEKNYNLRIRS